MLAHSLEIFIYFFQKRKFISLFSDCEENFYFPSDLINEFRETKLTRQNFFYFTLSRRHQTVFTISIKIFFLLQRIIFFSIRVRDVYVLSVPFECRLTNEKVFIIVFF